MIIILMAVGTGCSKNSAKQIEELNQKAITLFQQDKIDEAIQVAEK